MQRKRKRKRKKSDDVLNKTITLLDFGYQFS